MGRKQNRKRARRQRSRAGMFDLGIPPPGIDPWAPPVEPESSEEDDAIMALFTGRRPPGVKACGGCREFIEDGEFGRGTCLHPGSGVFAPWNNTPACDFYAARRR